MLTPEDKKRLHQTENELSVKEQEKRHLLGREQELAQEEHSLHNSLLRIEQELGKNKAEKHKTAELLSQVEDEIRQLHTRLKNIRM